MWLPGSWSVYGKSGREMPQAKAAGDCRTPGRFAKSDRFWSAAVLCRFGFSPLIRLRSHKRIPLTAPRLVLIIAPQMNLDALYSELTLKADAKLVLVVLDGLGDIAPPGTDSATPLEAANTPNLD